MAGELSRWMAQYTAAWDSNDPAAIARLFTTDADYRHYPWATPAHGTEAIVARWLSGADEPGDHRFSWQEVGADGVRHFVNGHTTYADGRAYENLWIIDLETDGRASRFTEWYVEVSKPLGPNA